MVDWASLAFNGLWVLGAAVILAAFGFSCYEAERQAEPLRTRLSAQGFQLPLAMGMFLISLGAALLASPWWERLLWGLLCLASIGQLWTGWRRTERRRTERRRTERSSQREE